MMPIVTLSGYHERTYRSRERLTANGSDLARCRANFPTERMLRRTSHEFTRIRNKPRYATDQNDSHCPVCPFGFENLFVDLADAYCHQVHSSLLCPADHQPVPATQSGVRHTRGFPELPPVH